MSDKNIIVYTMKGCPFCVQFKNMLSENGIEFYDRDIHEFQDEYQLFVEITGSELIPSLMVIEGNGEDYESSLYVPERDYNELTEALDIVKKKLNIIN
jgi:glutaredoxin